MITLTNRVNSEGGTISPPSVSITRRPAVAAPNNAKPVISPAAASFDTSPLPTAGPNATPVEEPPMLNPTNTATASPTTSRALTTPGFPRRRT